MPSRATRSGVAKKVLGHGRDWSPSRALLLASGLTVEPVTERDAERAAELCQRGSGLSLGDRLCQALAERLDAEVWTADTSRGHGDRIRQIR
ncbi:MAG: PIN domain-containing protein [Marmoricola sp.]